jgi:hypothetical protein
MTPRRRLEADLLGDDLSLWVESALKQCCQAYCGPQHLQSNGAKVLLDIAVANDLPGWIDVHLYNQRLRFSMPPFHYRAPLRRSAGSEGRFGALELQRKGLVQSIKSVWRHTPGL